MKKIKYIFLFLFVATLFSCDYELENTVEVDENVAYPMVKFSEDSKAFLIKGESVAFDVELITSESVESYDLFLTVNGGDEYKIHTSQNTTDKVVVSAELIEKISDGDVTLKIGDEIKVFVPSIRLSNGHIVTPVTEYYIHKKNDEDEVILEDGEPVVDTVRISNTPGQLATSSFFQREQKFFVAGKENGIESGTYILTATDAIEGDMPQEEVEITVEGREYTIKGNFWCGIINAKFGFYLDGELTLLDLGDLSTYVNSTSGTYKSYFTDTKYATSYDSSSKTLKLDFKPGFNIDMKMTLVKK